MGWIHVIRNRYVLLVYKRFRNNPFKPKYIFYVFEVGESHPPKHYRDESRTKIEEL